jgi:hypothetical protein
MEISGTALDDQSVPEPTSSLEPSAQPAEGPVGSRLDDPADDWDLRALDVTAGEPD